MRTPFVAGNWKMYKTVAEARHLVSEMAAGLEGVTSVQRVLCPPFTDLLAVAALLEGTGIKLGAQNMHWEAEGAFTGEISPVMVAELCQYVILGHSERRAYFGETDESVNRKVKAALAHNLTPIVCVGETLDENEAGRTDEVVSRQMLAGLDGVQLSAGQELVIAYEPVWAIGTGRSASPEMAQQAHGFIRSRLAGVASGGQETRLLYGGSVKSDNAASLFAMPDVDGGLIGGASLIADDFLAICRAAAALS